MPDISDIEEFKNEKETKKLKTTHKETWKSFERKVAKDFGTTRTPLSGMVKTITNSDTLHPKIYVECKLRADDFNFWEEFEASRNRNKLYYYKVTKSSTGNDLYLFDSEDFFKLIKLIKFDLNYLVCSGTSRRYTSVVSLFEQTMDRAEIEEKLPVVALKKKNKKGYLIGTHPKYIEGLRLILKRRKNE